jgi:AGCS family alanine or glycine:cation symporter
VICTLSALVILTCPAGVIDWNTNGVTIAAQAFTASLGRAAPGLLAVCITLFAFMSIISWSYYGAAAVRYLSSGTLPASIYKGIFVFVVFSGGLLGSSLIWDISDIFNVLMSLPNFAALYALSSVIVSCTRDYNKPT